MLHMHIRLKSAQTCDKKDHSDQTNSQDHSFVELNGVSPYMVTYLVLCCGQPVFV